MVTLVGKEGLREREFGIRFQERAAEKGVWQGITVLEASQKIHLVSKEMSILNRKCEMPGGLDGEGRRLSTIVLLI